jgi:hypothetical protein
LCSAMTTCTGSRTGFCPAIWRLKVSAARGPTRPGHSSTTAGDTGGSDWFMLHRSFADFVTGPSPLVRELRCDSCHPHGDRIRLLNPLWPALGCGCGGCGGEFRRFYDHTLLSAESFFHVVGANSEFCETMLDNNFRYANWLRERGCQCQVRGRRLCNWSPPMARDTVPAGVVAVQTSGGLVWLLTHGISAHRFSHAQGMRPGCWSRPGAHARSQGACVLGVHVRRRKQLRTIFLRASLTSL